MLQEEKTTTSLQESNNLRLLQSGYPKSGNYWLYKIIQQVLEQAQVPQQNFIINEPIYPLAQTWPLSYQEQASVNMVDILYNGSFYRISSIYRRKIDDMARYVAQNTHVWTHSDFCERSHRVFPLFSKIIYIIRDPRDMILSATRFQFSEYMQRHWPTWHETPEQYLQHELVPLAEKWRSHVSGYLQHARQYNIHVLFYERLLERFLSELASLLSYLGLNLRDEQQQQVEEAVSYSSLKQESPNHVRKARLYNWRKQLSEQQNEQVLEAAGNLIHQLGYPLRPQEEDQLPMLPESGGEPK